MEKKDFFKQVGRNIKSLRIRKNLSKEELAEKIGVTDRTITNWESGKNTNAYDLFILSEAFNCDIKDFYLV